MKRIITLLLSVFMCLFFVAGCTKQIAPSGDFNLGGSEESVEKPTDPTKGEPFTVKLHTTDGGKLKGLEKVQAIWTEVSGANVYQAAFDSQGEAVSYKPDGDYRVTLTEAPDGYTYNPNIYFADNFTPEITIDLYPLRTLTGSGGGEPPDHFKMGSTGAYRFTFDSPSREYYFNFGVAYNGKISFESLLDVTQNEVLPVFYDANTIFYWGIQKAIVGGGAENTYTKNFYYECDLTGSQNKLFKIGVKTVNEKAFPITIDMLIQKNGEYSDTGSNLTVVPAPENLPLADEIEVVTGKTFVSLPKVNGNVLDEKMVYFNEEDGYYYLKVKENGVYVDKPDLTKRIFARLTKDVPGLMEGEGAGLSYPMVRHTCYNSKKDYTQFINEYFAKVNSDGSYPVSPELKEYLFDFCVSKQIFFDGLGTAEPEYQTDAESRWLFVCGYYR